MQARREQALELMMQFADGTGLTSERPEQRYLWTDAFAVCNFFGLARATGKSPLAELAFQLVNRVHHVLGRHRADDPRSGWISALAEEAGEAHPTAGGLRIGKPLPERQPDELVDERREWDRDGQYFHYLTKWMHALDQLARSSGQPLFNVWARELAQAAHRAFTYTLPHGGSRRMYWKLSVDLSRPLVASMGQHDPLDGLVTYAQLQAHAAGPGPNLNDAIADFAAMVEPGRLATGDPLGIGGLLVDACRIAQLGQQATGIFGLVEPLLEAARAGLQHYTAQPDLRLPAARRLAFRELGLAIGLATLEWEGWSAAAGALRGSIDRLARYVPLRGEIEAFWLQPTHRRGDTWLEHANINDVMLATSLEPAGFLMIQ